MLGQIARRSLVRGSAARYAIGNSLIRGVRPSMAPIGLGKPTFTQSQNIRSFSLWGWWPSGSNKPQEVSDTFDAVQNSLEATPEAAGKTVEETVDKAVEMSSQAPDAISQAADTVSKFDTSLDFGTSDTVSQLADAASSLTPDDLGYMHSIGLADGWWPSDIIQESLEFVHVFTGMPWWATIAVTTVAFRIVLFPLFMKSSDTMARSQEIMPETKRLRQEVSDAISRGDQRMQQMKMFQLKQLNKKHGIKYRNMFLSPATQMAFTMGSFFGIREMTNLPMEGLSTGGAYWFPDLTAADPYIGLQLLSACLYAGSFKLGGETAMAQYGPKMKKLFMVLPFASVLFTWNLSAGVMVYLTANGVMSVIQSQLLRSTGFRKWAGMVPLNMKKVEAKAAEEEKSKGMMGKLTEGWEDMKNNSKVRADMQVKADKAIAVQKKRAGSGRIIVKKKRSTRQN